MDVGALDIDKCSGSQIYRPITTGVIANAKAPIGRWIFDVSKSSLIDQNLLPAARNWQVRVRCPGFSYDPANPVFVGGNLTAQIVAGQYSAPVSSFVSQLLHTTPLLLSGPPEVFVIRDLQIQDYPLACFLPCSFRFRAFPR